MTSTYELEWQRQKLRTDIPPGHLPVHRWYLRFDDPRSVEKHPAPQDGLSLARAVNPAVHFYRYLYHTAGEEFLWGDRRRMSDKELAARVNKDDVHVMVLYDHGTPAGFFEMDLTRDDVSEVKYFALLPGNLGKGLGSYMLTEAIRFAGKRDTPLILDTCSLDHPSALENYKKRGFVLYREEDEEYPDPRLDSTVPKDVGKHVPLAKI